jgi:hypothetical protein
LLLVRWNSRARCCPEFLDVITHLDSGMTNGSVQKALVVQRTLLQKVTSGMLPCHESFASVWLEKHLRAAMAMGKWSGRLRHCPAT